MKKKTRRAGAILLLSLWNGVASLFVLGCASPSGSSELLQLSHVDEAIVDVLGQETENIYDPLNLLQRGEAYTLKGDYLSASEEYKRFLELFPLHRMASFAQYSLGLSYEHQITTTDRDPTPIERAKAAFENVLTHYPETLYALQAAEKIRKLTQKQAEHQFKIGHFYYKKKAYPAAIARFELALAQGDNGEVTEKTLYYMGLSHRESGDPKKGEEALQRLRTQYPNSDYLRKVLP